MQQRTLITVPTDDGSFIHCPFCGIKHNFFHTTLESEKCKHYAVAYVEDKFSLDAIAAKFYLD